MQVLEKPIIVIGAPRSGTTFLFNVLSSHPDLTGFNEPRLVWRYGNDRGSDYLRADDARPEVVSYIRRYFERETVRAGASRFVEKTPANALRIPFVDRIFPDAKFLITHRNGVDAALSAAYRWEHKVDSMDERAPQLIRQRLREVGVRRLPYYAVEFLRRVAPGPLKPLVGRSIWGPRLPGMRGMMKELDTLELAVIQWRACVEHAHQDAQSIPSDRVLEMRLEDLSRSRISDILTFCELNYDHAVEEAFERYLASRPPRSHASASVHEIAAAKRGIEPTMAWLGYPDSS